MRALEGLVELLRIAEQDDRARGARHGEHVGERHLTRLVDEEDVEQPIALGRRPQPDGSSSHVVLVVGDSVPRLGIVFRDRHTVVVDGLVVLGDLLDASDRHAGFGSGILDVPQEVADHLVAVGADAHLPAARNQSHDHPGTGVGLSRARRALDGEGSVVHRLDDATRGIESGLTGLLQGIVRDLADRWRASKEHVARRAPRAGGVDPVLRDPLAQA